MGLINHILDIPSYCKTGDIIRCIFSPYETAIGPWFWMIIVSIIFTISWIKSGSAVVPTITFLVLATFLFIFLPDQAHPILFVLIPLGGFAIIYKLFKR